MLFIIILFCTFVNIGVFHYYQRNNLCIFNIFTYSFNNRTINPLSKAQYNKVYHNICPNWRHWNTHTLSTKTSRVPCILVAWHVSYDACTSTVIYHDCTDQYWQFQTLSVKINIQKEENLHPYKWQKNKRTGEYIFRTPMRTILNE